ncbi:sensor histidine kinase [Methylobacterium sp. J-090]|uniref:sensor histidine kinase n=1 Tax=Methylobacterium sp. J-090 TaxID=2836666 RepID=UPI001FB893EC|nr:HAMP domain-containing sensor histidine kinase [Methylobacterium sp. J-090]MCJ2082875.1 HAMP domain-containing histidine kinase [Methylobacterium sp. J-090]
MKPRSELEAMQTGSSFTAEETPATGTQAAWVSRRLGLSGRVFLLTIALVGLCEILIYVPTVANYRVMWLSDRIAAAYVAALVIDATPDHTVSVDLTERILTGVGAQAVIVTSGDARRIIARAPLSDSVSRVVDLRSNPWTHSIAGAWATLFQPAPTPIRVIGKYREGFDPVEVVLDEAPLRRAMAAFCLRLLGTSLTIAAVVAGLVFLVLQRAIVRPVRLLVSNITSFADEPEETGRVIVPSGRNDEIGDAEVALARMEAALAAELRAKRHLADLGLSVSKINHEMRNLLTTAQLLGDRLEGVADPAVQRVAPRLVTTLGRAIRFCEETLAYGRATERNPQQRTVPLAPILADQADMSGREPDSPVVIRERCAPDITVHTDPEQLSRALANLVRNAVQALSAEGGNSAPRISLEARRTDGSVTILVIDNGPGLPARARAHLFEPFKGSTRPGGTGLGLAIAAELIELNGGTITLDQAEAGVCFRITMPAGKA